jgi:translation initiation factor 5
MPRINVDRKFLNDFSYRYTMPEIETKAEGGGNGKRTILLNILEIANELKRSPESIITYLSTDLGCQNIVNKEGKYVLYGDFTKQIIQNKIYDYIDSFVLCQKCKNPETYFSMHGKNDVCMKCNACPETSFLPINKTSIKVIKQIILKLKESLK